MARILVIEDEADIRHVLEYNLQQAGHEVVGVDRGKVGLETANARPPDLVLLDLMLPDMSGLDVCRTLKTDARPLLLKTNLAAGHGGASGRYDYLREVAFDYAFILGQMGIGTRAGA